jgi:allophanate hydrolase
MEAADPIESLPFTLADLRRAYGEGLSPAAVVAEACRRLESAGDPGILILEVREQALAAARALGPRDGRPLWGVPFVVKDNIDVAGLATTAGCPDFAHVAREDAFVVSRLKDAGAILIGKANLDQFATGLVGVRSPYRVPRNAIDPDLVPGGSSSGSAVAVARGIVAFSLGTDTAGSGRVPAALNNIVGLKPTLGALSATGVVPACRTLDTISVFAMTVAEAYEIYGVAAGYDPRDAYSRPVPVRAPTAMHPGIRIGIPDEATLQTFGDREQAEHFSETLVRLRTAGAAVTEIDFEPFHAVARMLYEGAWLAERVAALGKRLVDAPETLHPTTRAVLEPGLTLTAVDAFEGMYRLKALARRCEELMEDVDLLCVPTIPTVVTLDEIAADPIGPNAMLGTYTNFVNLLDLCGIAVPTGPRSDGRPGSLTVLARKGEDHRAASVAMAIEAGTLGATGWPRPVARSAASVVEPGEIAIAVCGAHMSGLPLNPELTSRGARFLKACRTAPEYALHALAGGPPLRPGMVRKRGGGAAIEIEVWALPRAAFGDFMAGIPSPLAIGSLALDDGSLVKGFLCEPYGLEGARDISHFGGWRGYLRDKDKPHSSGARAHAV